MRSDLTTPTESALVGPPNAGKTTLYNWLTGSHFSTVNYPGSTVEYSLGKTIEIYGAALSTVDTPGIYSLNPKSPEEVVTITALYQGLSPKVIVAVVDATQLVRHLFLVRQLQEAGFKCVIALTMMDLLKARGLTLDLKILSEKLKTEIFPIDGRLGGGVKELVAGIRKRTVGSEASIKPLPDWNAEKIERVYKELSELGASVLASQSQSPQAQKQSRRVDGKTARMDRWLMHPVFGLIFFLLIMGTLFSCIYWLAQPMMDLVDESFSFVSDTVQSWGEGTLWADFLSKGVVAGIGSVVIFVPQIFVLFLGMVFLEDWGYLARAAAIIDRPMAKLGLNGRSFVPLLSGYACAIPAMMAARTISSRRERLLTLFVIPLMSCSARLPVYALLLAYLFQGEPVWKPGLALLSLYVGSMIVGAIAATLASRIMKSDEKSMFMLELPTYRKPLLFNVIRSAGRRTLAYLQKAGPAILVLSLIIWAGTTFPNYQVQDENQRLASSYAATLGRGIEPAMTPMGVDWRVGVGLIAAFAAREVFVAALALIFNITDTDEDSLQDTLLSSMKNATTSDGYPLFTTSSVIGLILFFMIALQCLSTVAVAKKESGSWKFAAWQLLIFTGAAYAVTVVVVQGLRAFGVS